MIYVVKCNVKNTCRWFNLLNEFLEKNNKVLISYRNVASDKVSKCYFISKEKYPPRKRKIFNGTVRHTTVMF